MAATPDAAFEAAAPVTSFVSAALAPFVGIAGRTAPAQPLSVWTMLNLLGREMQRTWFNRRPQIRDQHHHIELGDAGDVSQRIPLGGFDPDGDALQYSVPDRGELGGPRFGTVTLDQTTGTYTYDPDDSFAQSGGTDTFVVRLADSSPRPLHGLLALLRGGNTDFAVVNVTVAPVRTPPLPPPPPPPPVNPPPVDPPPVDPATQQPEAVADSFRVDEDTALSGNVLTNDIDRMPDDGTALTAELAAGPTHGSLTLNEDGSFTYTPNANFSGEDSFDYRVVHGSIVGNVATATITVVAPADVPVVELPAGGLVAGAEDSAIALGIKVSTRFPDEALRVTIEGVPDGAVLSTGADNGDGSWTLDRADLDGLTVTPPSNYAGSFDLTITAIAADGSAAAAVLTVEVTSVADVPVIELPPGDVVTGAEDTAIALDINVSSGDPDEAVTVMIEGVPDGAVLSSGVDNGDGSWTLDRADLDGLTVTPPADFSGSIGLFVTAIGVDGSTAKALLTVVVEPVVDVPVVELPAGGVVIGSEDSAIALGINVSSGDPDETVTVTIEGVPDGALLSAGSNNGDGTWTLTAAEAANVSIRPAQDYFGTLTLAITATATDSSGAVAATTTSLVVDVVNVGDIPQLQLPGDENQIVTGREGAPLDIGFAVLTPDVGSDVTITIGEVPSDAVLSAGIDNGDGTWTLTAAEAADLSITMPEDYFGWFGLTIFAEVRDAAGEGGSIFTSLIVDFRPVADVPVVELPDGGLVIGAEDTSIALGLNVSSPDPIETVTVTVGGVPAGAVLSAGFDNGDGSWTVRADEVPGLTVTPALNFSGDFDLTVTATAVDGAGGTATTTAVLTVAVTPVADMPWLQVEAGEIRAAEGDAIPLGLSVASGDPDETVTVTIEGLPNRAVLSAGTRNNDGSWTVDQADLDGLTVRPPSGYAGAFTLTVTAVATDGDQTVSISDVVAVYVAAHVPVPDLQVPTEVTGSEDSAIALGISVGIDDPDEAVTVIIGGVPAGASLSAGRFDRASGQWIVDARDLSELTITPPADSADDFVLTVLALATQGDQTTESEPVYLRVNVIAVADSSTAWADDVTAVLRDPIELVIGGQLTDIDGSETLTYVLSSVPNGFVLDRGINNGDNTWTLREEQLAGLRLVAPHRFEGSLELTVSPVAHDEDGSVTVGDGASFVVTIGTGGPHIDIRGGRPGDVGVGVIVNGTELDLLASSGEFGTPTGIYVREGGVIDGAPLIELLNVGLLGLVGGIELSGLPAGTLVNGVLVTDGRWSSGLVGGLGSPLVIQLPPGSDADFELLGRGGSLLGLPTPRTVLTPVTVMGAADPVANASSVAVHQGDGTVALDITGELTDTDGSETLSYLISGVPAGFQLNRGIDNGNGTWSLTAAESVGLVLTPPADWAGPDIVNLTVSHVVTEDEGDQAVVQTGASFTMFSARDL